MRLKTVYVKWIVYSVLAAFCLLGFLVIGNSFLGGGAGGYKSPLDADHLFSRGEKYVELKKGTFTISKTLNIPEGVILNGNGCFLKPSSSFEGTYLVEFQGTNSRVSGINLLCNRTVSGVNFSAGTSRNIYTESYIEYPKDFALHVLGTGNSILDIYAKGSIALKTNTGLYLASTDNFVDNCRFAMFGIGVHIAQSANLLSNIKSFYNFGDAYLTQKTSEVESPTSPIRNLTMVNCQAEESAGQGFNLFDIVNSNIQIVSDGNCTSHPDYSTITGLGEISLRNCSRNNITASVNNSVLGSQGRFSLYADGDSKFNKIDVNCSKSSDPWAPNNASQVIVKSKSNSLFIDGISYFTSNFSPTISCDELQLKSATPITPGSSFTVATPTIVFFTGKGGDATITRGATTYPISGIRSYFLCKAADVVANTSSSLSLYYVAISSSNSINVGYSEVTHTGRVVANGAEELFTNDNIISGKYTVTDSDGKEVLNTGSSYKTAIVPRGYTLHSNDFTSVFPVEYSSLDMSLTDVLNAIKVKTDSIP